MKTVVLTVCLTMALAAVVSCPPTLLAQSDPGERAVLSAIKKDPAWKPACAQVAIIQVGQTNQPGGLRNFCLTASGDILAAYGGKWASYPQAVTSLGARRLVQVSKPTEIRVYSSAGQLKATWPLSIVPQALCAADDGTVYVGGEGKLCKLDSSGKVLLTVDFPVKPGSKAAGNKAVRKDITGFAVSGEDVFAACTSPTDLGYQVYRLDRQLQNPVAVVSKLSGCCGQMDIAAANGKLVVAHNGRHSVETYNRDGKLISKFGKRDEKAAQGFGGCCEPKNVRVAPNGDILAAESGPPTSIKRFSADGKFLRVEALPTQLSGCVRVTVAASPDGKQLYLLNTDRDSIHVFAAKP